MLTIHHLGRSQSERIVWLCEELGLAYDLKIYDRDPVTILAPAAFKALHPMGAAPVIEDAGILIAESGAVVDYILARYGQGRLRPAPDHPDFVPYLAWYHFANGTLQPTMGRNMTIRRLDPSADHPVRRDAERRLHLALSHIEGRLAGSDYLAGADLSAADIMAVFSLTTMRVFLPFDLQPYPAILRYLARIGARDAYRRAMAKGDPGFAPLLT